MQHKKLSNSDNKVFSPRTKIAKWVLDVVPQSIQIVGDLDYRGKDRKEDAELIDAFSWFRKNYPQYAHLAFHPENEFVTNGGSSYAQHAMSKKKGRLDGLCDFILLSPAQGMPNLLIEFKRVNIAESVKGASAKAHFVKQINLLSKQAKTGAVCYLCLGVNNFKIIIANHFHQDYYDNVNTISPTI